MIQLELEKCHLEFIKQYNAYGFKNETELINKALEYFQQKLNSEEEVNQKIESENEDNDPFIDGLFSGTSDLASSSEEILSSEIKQHSGWTWK